MLSSTLEVPRPRDAERQAHRPGAHASEEELDTRDEANREVVPCPLDAGCWSQQEVLLRGVSEVQAVATWTRRWIAHVIVVDVRERASGEADVGTGDEPPREAVPLDPVTMAPACPIRLPTGASNPAM